MKRINFRVSFNFLALSTELSIFVDCIYNNIQFDILIHNQYGYHFQNIDNKFKNLRTSIMMIYVEKFNLIQVFLEKTKTPKNNTERTFFRITYIKYEENRAKHWYLHH